METENEQVIDDAELQEETTAEEEVEQTEEQPIEETQQEDDTVTLSKSEYKKLQRKAIAYDATKDTPKPKETSNYNVTPEVLQRIELRQDGYSKEEAEAIMELGGVKALKNPFVQAAIEIMRAKSKSKESNQSLNSKSPVYKKFTQEDLSKMSSKELAAILPHD